MTRGIDDNQHSCTNEGFRPGVGFLSEQEQADRRDVVLAYDYESEPSRPLPPAPSRIPLICLLVIVASQIAVGLYRAAFALTALG